MAASLTRFSFIIKIAIYCFLFFHIAEVDCQNTFDEQLEGQNAPVPNEYQAPYGAQLPNGHQEQLGTLQKGAQFLNNNQLPSVAQQLNDVELFGDSLNPMEKGVLSALTGINKSAFLNNLKYFQKTFFDDLANNAKMPMMSSLKPNVSLECLKSLQDLLVGLMERKQWAVRIIDSFGKFPSGILDGSIRSYGDFHMCVDTKMPDFQGRYCLVNVSFDGFAKRPPFAPTNLSFLFDRDFTKSLPTYEEISSITDAVFTTAICVPSTCSEKDVQSILSKVMSYGLQPLDAKLKDCTIKQKDVYNSTQNTIAFVILALILFEAFATLLDVRLRNSYGEQFNIDKLSKTVQCILAFSYYSNTIRLFKKDESPDSIKIFHGMKFICLAWVVWGHTVFCLMLVLGRMYDFYLMTSGLFFQITASAIFATETFFFMSGFLVVYSYVKASCPRLNFIMFALYRYMRMIPSFLLILGCLLLSENWSSGPLWKEHIIGYLVGSCKTTWWKNLFFLNSSGGLRDSCLPWTWYIAVDMQLYMCSYLILLLIRRNPKRALLILKIIIVASIIGLMFYHVAYNLPPSPSLSYIQFLDIPYYSKMIHFGTHNHVTSYSVGMIMGYFIATKKKIHLSKIKKLLGWCVAILFLLMGVFLTYIWNHNGRIATLIESALIGGIQRFLWSIMLSWIVYLCLNGEAGKVKSILSADIFVPFSRLTYTVYLVHPFIQMLCVGQLKHVLFPELKMLMIFFFAFLIVSYVFAYAACMICELPFSRLLSILMSSKHSKSDKKSK